MKNINTRPHMHHAPLSQLKQRTSVSRHFHIKTDTHLICVFIIRGVKLYNKLFPKLQSHHINSNVCVSFWGGGWANEERKRFIENSNGMNCLLMSAKSRCFPFYLSQAFPFIRFPLWFSLSLALYSFFVSTFFSSRRSFITTILFV